MGTLVQRGYRSLSTVFALQGIILLVWMFEAIVRTRMYVQLLIQHLRPDSYFSYPFGCNTPSYHRIQEA